MTPYATELLSYVRGNMPQGTDCEVWLDENISKDWRSLTEQPYAGEIIIDDIGEEL